MKKTDALASANSSKQFIKFSNDAIGLERVLRLCESIAILLSSYPFLVSILITVLSSANGKSPLSIEHVRLVAVELRQRFGLARRFFRVFRCYEFFYGAHVLFSTLAQTEQSSSKRSQGGHSSATLLRWQAWIDVLGKTCNGMWFLLDGSTIVDALRVDGLQIWGHTMQRIVLVEAQRFWLFALVCGIVSGLLRILALLWSTPVPNSTTTEKSDTAKSEALSKERSAEIYATARTVATNAVDTVLPGSVVGWMRVEPGIVGIAMFCTTIVTGLDAWRRCGREAATK